MRLLAAQKNSPNVTIREFLRKDGNELPIMVSFSLQLLEKYLHTHATDLVMISEMDETTELSILRRRDGTEDSRGFYHESRNQTPKN